ncbi:hypothetical protein [uncultured Lactococcus sp.]|uniref:hypothetical protein n=1 Tax=uncultured Lactococcus sp. TaxID=167973 RepID=UPI0027DE3C21|nr:hypothetical protein [uncultured Lactococcus sp.]
MFTTYLQFWKKIFKYQGKSDFKELLVSLIVNTVILFILFLIGLIVPVTLENLIVDVIYITMIIMILPTVSLIIRLIRN